MARFLYPDSLCVVAVPADTHCCQRKAIPGYGQRWWQRLGWAPMFAGGEAPIWLHAVSVGETIAAKPLVDALKQQYPHVPILVTGMTATGAERVQALLGDKVVHAFAPTIRPILSVAS